MIGSGWTKAFLELFIWLQAVNIIQLLSLNSTQLNDKTDLQVFKLGSLHGRLKHGRLV